MRFDWWTDLSPWLQGLFGGAGATLLWELVLRPRRARHSLARVLAAEVSLALEYCAAARLQVNVDPKGIPGDFRIGTLAFDAVASKLGDLPGSLIAEVVLFYHHVQVVNAMPQAFGETLTRWRSLAIVGDTPERQSLREDLDRTLVVYRNSLEKLVERANDMLPRLKRTSVPWWRIDYLFRKKKRLSLEELASRLAAHNEKTARGLAKP